MGKFEFRVPTKENNFGTEPLTVLETVKRLVQNISWMTKLLGCNMLSPDYTVFTIPFFFTIQTVLGITILNLYGLYLYHNDLDKLLFSLVTLMSILQGIPML